MNILHPKGLYLRIYNKLRFMKSLLSIAAILLISVASSFSQESIHTYKLPALEDGEVDFASFKGKKILVVNTASECGLTPQYKDLQVLHEKYGDKLVIVGVPANNFGQQEPGSNEQIAAFCEKNYGVEFTMCAKQSVKGDDMCELYQFLTKKSKNGLKDSEVQWNFQKYLLDENGMLIEVFSPRVLPMSEELVSKL